MPTLSAEQIVAYARQAGFPQKSLATITAIVLAESGGTTDAVGDVGLQTETWGPSIGLAQIRSLKAQSGTGQPRDAQRLTDPLFNLKSALVISNNGTRWTDWSVFNGKDPKYVLYMLPAQKAVAATSNPESNPVIVANPASGLTEKVGGAVKAVTDPMQAIGDIAHTLGNPNTWVRVLEVVAGMTALVLGAVLLGKEVAPALAADTANAVIGMASAG